MSLHYYIKVLFTSISLFWITSVFAQEKRVAVADEEFENFRFIDAQKIYLKVVERGYKSADIYKKLGDSYYFNAELEDAATWYGALYNEYKSEMTSEYLFRYSQSLKGITDYNRADEIMVEFDQLTGGTERRAQLFDKERNYMNLIEMQSGRFILSDVGVNSSFSDFAPSFHLGEIIFSSARHQPVKKIIHEWNERPFLDLFSALPDNKSLVGASRISGKVNTKFHESSSTFTKDGKVMYFTRNNFIDNKLSRNSKGTILLKLYRSEFIGGKWQDAEELPFNSDEYSNAHPALSPDETKLYFASDMPGGKGQSDIYVVDILGDNKFGIPRNLGEKVNTEGRETFPYISDIGRMYLASDGHLGLGGLDVFVAVPDGDSFDKPINVGRPVNSSHDDFTFILNEETKIGYFASNRPGGAGSDDIYSFVQTDELITKCRQSVVGVVTDSESTQPLARATITLFDDDMNEVREIVTDVSGRYKFTLDCEKNYIIRGDKEGYRVTEVKLETDYQFEYEHDKDIQLVQGDDRLKENKAFIGDDLAKLLNLQSIYFDLDKSAIRPDAEVELQKVIAALQEYPQINIDVRSHTDSRAGDNYNLRLSERRAKSTIKYIVEKGGIEANRVSGKGYGESELVNECGNGVSCTDEQHQLNRRSEFIIVEKDKEED